ncbi:hypothetical protein ACH5RR_035022 [Cinchona calisaya]|uniref:Uncharacterized protein n=1 Tax=Cinchona calisaya TaxID=153742 RepID=A0ABD2YEP9_9GENT
MVFYREEEPPNPSKRCKCLSSTLKDAFSDCHTFRGRLSFSTPEDDHLPSSDYDEEEEVFVSAVISKYMESKTRRGLGLTVDSFSWALSPETRELFVAPKSNAMQQKSYDDDEEMEEFFSPRSYLSRCASVTSLEPFGSAKATFSRASSLSRIDFQDFGRRRLIIQQLSHCKGWPFGLCNKAMLLPPLPKSPSDSWLWRKSTRGIRIQ